VLFCFVFVADVISLLIFGIFVLGLQLACLFHCFLVMRTLWSFDVEVRCPLVYILNYFF